MRVLLAFIMLCASAFAQQVDPLVSDARSGETVTLEIENADPADAFNVYRKTSVTSTPVLMATIPVHPDVYTYYWDYRMPTGTTPQYRFWVVVKRGGVLEGESNVVRVKRVK